MIFRDGLAHLPRRGTLHLMQTSAGVGWSAGALTPGASADDAWIAIGPSCIGVYARAVPSHTMHRIAAPAGVTRLAARRLRAWVLRRGFCPLRVIASGAAAGELAACAFATIDRTSHRCPPTNLADACRLEASAWRAALQPCDRSAVRDALGIPRESFTVLAGGDWARGIDALEAFTIVGRAALAEADLTLVVSSRARWINETRRFAQTLQMSSRLVVVDDAEVPSALWTVADAMLLLQPSRGEPTAWWGHCAWWAAAAGMTVIAQECATELDDAIQVSRLDRSAPSRVLIDMATHAAPTVITQELV